MRMLLCVIAIGLLLAACAQPKAPEAPSGPPAAGQGPAAQPEGDTLPVNISEDTDAEAIDFDASEFSW
ncbi:MAG: hypothetical protein V1735_03830 [Nanoarchaeota archaeon]